MDFFLLLPFIILLGTVYISDVAGTISLIGTKEWFTLTALILPVVYLLLLPGAPSNSRFRLPAMPEMCLIAGLGIDWAWGHFIRRKNSGTTLASK